MASTSVKRKLFDPSPDPARPLGVFLSYSNKDKSWRNYIDEHLTSLKRENLIEVWYDRLLLAGARWDPKIMRELRNSDLVLLLTSASFMRSEFCYSREMETAIDCQAKGDLVVVPIAVHDCDWGEARFAELTSIPERNRPLSSWSNRHAGLKVVATGLRRLVEVIRAARRGEIDIPEELSLPVLATAAASIQDDHNVRADRILEIAVESADHRVGTAEVRELPRDNAAALRRSVQPRRTVFLPLLCNRDGPATAVEAALAGYQKAVQRRPLLCVLEGDEREAHEAFVDRIVSDILPRAAATLAGQAIHNLPAVRWPDEAPPDATAFQLFGPKLAASLQLPLFTREDQIRAALTREKGITIVRTSLFAQDWDTHGQHLLEAWLSLWNEWPKIQPGRLLLVLLLVKYQFATAEHPRISEIRERNSRLRQICAGIDQSRYPGLLICHPPPLVSIKRKHVSEWLDCEPVRQWSASTGGAWRVDKHVRDLFIVHDEAPMEVVLERLDTVLREFRKAG